MSSKDHFTCPDCDKRFNVHHDTYFVDDYAKKVCPSCWEKRQVATKGDVEKMIGKNPHGIKLTNGWTTAYRVVVLIALVGGLFVILSNAMTHKRSVETSAGLDAAKLWQENQELKADNEWLRMQNKRHELAWKRLDDYNSDNCEFPPRKFDHYLDFGYAHCKPANKKGESWNLITKHIWGRALFWYCATREGGAPEDNLPRKQREVMRRDIDGCVLHWTQVLDRGVGKGQTSVPARGLRVEVDWELKTRKP